MDSTRFARLAAMHAVEPGMLQSFSRARVAIVGLGGLGHPVAAYLAAAGVGALRLIDDGVVDEPDLGRQILFGPADLGRRKADVVAERLHVQNPDIDLEIRLTRLDLHSGSELLKGIDVVVDGTDSLGARRATNACAMAAGIPAVFGGAVGLNGFVQAVLPGSACYDCVWTDRTHCGDCAEVGVLGPLVGVVGATQATEAMKILLGLGETLAGKLLLIDVLQSSWRTVDVRRRADCPTCGAKN